MSASGTTLFEFMKGTDDNITVSTCPQIGEICVVFIFSRNTIFLSGEKKKPIEEMEKNRELE